MNELIGRVFDFEKKVYEDSRALYSKLANHGQEPKALIISCADSRIVPEQIMQAQPGDLFVCRNAGNGYTSERRTLACASPWQLAISWPILSPPTNWLKTASPAVSIIHAPLRSFGLWSQL